MKKCRMYPILHQYVVQNVILIFFDIQTKLLQYFFYKPISDSAFVSSRNLFPILSLYIIQIQNPSKFIRYIYNRVILENAESRYSALKVLNGFEKF